MRLKLKIFSGPLLSPHLSLPLTFPLSNLFCSQRNLLSPNRDYVIYKRALKGLEAISQIHSRLSLGLLITFQNKYQATLKQSINNSQIRCVVNYLKLKFGSEIYSENLEWRQKPSEIFSDTFLTKIFIEEKWCSLIKRMLHTKGPIRLQHKVSSF